MSASKQAAAQPLSRSRSQTRDHEQQEIKTLHKKLLEITKEPARKKKLLQCWQQAQVSFSRFELVEGKAAIFKGVPRVLCALARKGVLASDGPKVLPAVAVVGPEGETRQCERAKS
jgi:hypothetical protein